jgi:Phytanoyl-CoA dioxygenase (PhyH)
MLTDEHVEHYRTFGFVILRRQLDEETIAALSAEIDHAFRDAFGDRFDERPDAGGISGHYLPVMSTERTPVSLGLLECFDPIARRLLDGEALPAPAQAILFFDQAAWHEDTGFAVTAVKFACYLESLTAANGALRVLSGSYLDTYRDTAKRFDRRVMAQNRDELQVTVERVPAYVCETRPGDVIAFDLRLYHASIYGRDRRQWTVTYYRDDGSDALKEALADEAAPGYGSWGDYDPERYPFYDPAWVAELDRDWRVHVACRLRELSVFDAAARPQEVKP